MKIILLDAGPLGILANPGNSPLAFQCRAWADGLLAQGDHLLISEVADYEVRRELLRAGKIQSVARLDSLKTAWPYLPINTSTMLKAAEFWARARQLGKPTASNLRLDADAILVAQADLLIADGEDVVIATDNVRHLSLFVPAENWRSIL